MRATPSLNKSLSEVLERRKILCIVTSSAWGGPHRRDWRKPPPELTGGI